MAATRNVKNAAFGEHQGTSQSNVGFTLLESIKARPNPMLASLSVSSRYLE